MRLEVLLLSCVIELCTGVRLNPLENNDKLQDITNLYVAEWQWESWPVKQDLSEQEGKSPSQRKNAALWKDSSGSAWYLFGGQPVNGDPNKVFSDVWKFTVKTRAWKRLFPTQTNIKEANTNKTGDIMPLLTNLRNEKNAARFNHALQNLVLCGGLKKPNPNKLKKMKVWNSYRRKIEKDETEDKLTSLAVYAPKSSKSNTVWQIDAKNKQWTAYICCCETVKNRNENLTTNSSKNLQNKNKIPNDNQTTVRVSDINKSLNTEKNSSKTNKVEEESVIEQQPTKVINMKSKKRKINQIRNNSDNLYLKKIRIEKRGSGVKNISEETKLQPPKTSTTSENKPSNLKSDTTHEKGESSSKLKITTERSNKTEKSELLVQPKMASKYCPEFTENDTSVTWCDGKNEVIITSDIKSPEIVLWVFNLSTSHWSELKVNMSDGIKWPACADMNSIRYTGNEEEVYIICSKLETTVNKTCPENSTDSSKIPSTDNYNEKLVFRINYKDRVLCDLGNIQLNSHFSSLEGEQSWQNESQVILQLIRNSENETILIIAYEDMVDLWVLGRDQKGKERFHLVEKIWRGSALKWFDKYYAALYSLQFISESGNSETILLPNPRKIESNEYWPRERGRFIIRVFRNENLKNQSFENRTREQNLTYELLQSDYKPPGSENQLNHVYSLKVLIFFGLSLSIFTIFGTVLFLKRCVNCPPRIRVRNESHKSPLIIRYSVIPDDLLYPMA